MIERNALLEIMGLTPRQLARLRSFRLIPAPTFRPVPGRGASESYYPAETLARIAAIQRYQADGLSLADIAEIMQDSKVAVAVGGEFPGGIKAGETSNPDTPAAISRLMDRLKREFGADRILDSHLMYEERGGQTIVWVPLVVYR